LQTTRDEWRFEAGLERGLTVVRQQEASFVTAITRTASYVLMLLSIAGVARAQERPYFVTYDDHVEERGEWELSVLSTTAKARDEGTRYVAPWIELEYGVTSKWTTELYLESTTFRGDGSAFTGWRLENRYRPFKGEHLFNPVLYIEYESINEASRIEKEIVGRGPLPVEPIRSLAEEHANDLEGRFILSSWFGNLNVSENFIVEKNLSHDEGYEFGYAVGVSWPLRGTWDGECRFCAGALTPALEVYGGLGTTGADASGATRQFVAPVISWHLTRGSMFRASAGFGVTSSSDRFMFRVGYSIELE
jgi:hypothetical protein